MCPLPKHPTSLLLILTFPHTTPSAALQVKQLVLAVHVYHPSPTSSPVLTIQCKSRSSSIPILLYHIVLSGTRYSYYTGIHMA
jgi:hypothetical protein